MKKIIFITIIIIGILFLLIKYNRTHTNIQSKLDAGSSSVTLENEKVKIQTKLNNNEDGFLDTILLGNSQIIDTYPQVGLSRAYIEDIFVSSLDEDEYLFVIVYWDMSNPNLEATFDTSIWNVFVYNSDLILNNELSEFFGEGFSDKQGYEFDSREKIKKHLKFFRRPE
ncbi:hypothetical protein CL684_02990 [Candidatus Campbellbacteria bacterium]|nr:hypothetical protein [Candidatus Campbellbacteria bacterium]|tara:strand:- start:87 stop:593 length:507 start_codon:yes stop_codon:yes gene_type:complete